GLVCLISLSCLFYLLCQFDPFLLLPPSSTLFPYATLFRSPLDEPRHLDLLLQVLREQVRHLPLARRLRNGQRRSVCRDLVVLHRSEEHTSELQSRENLVCRLLLEKKEVVYVKQSTLT